MGAPKPWPAEMIDRFARLWNDPSHTITTIGLAMGISPGTVAGRARRLGLPCRGQFKGHIRGTLRRKGREQGANAATRAPARTAPAARGPTAPPPLASPPPRAPTAIATRGEGCCRHPLWGEAGRRDPLYQRYCDAPTGSPRRLFCAEHAKTNTISSWRAAADLAREAERVVPRPRRMGMRYSGDEPLPLDLVFQLSA
jgi:hypothetical protein